jgi:tRNA-specific 2-thiouridylase
MSRIAVALSGGIDSAVAAARLVNEGHEVVGLTARLLPPDWPYGSGCCNEELAAEICRRLGMEHHIVDFAEEFRKHIVDYFVSAYQNGLTPNPCLPCNRVIKFGLLLARAVELGCEALATGHYVIRQRRGDRWGVRRGADREKEQSYVLIGMTQEQLSGARFPLGQDLKANVVEEARKLGLPAVLRESQDVCFVDPDAEYGKLLEQWVCAEPGPIFDRAGRRLGTHRGLIYYTVGQRRGLGLGGGQRLYVIAKDPTRQALIVGRREELCREEFEVENVNWVSMEPPRIGEPMRCQVMVRYRGALLDGTVTRVRKTRCRVQVGRHDQAIAPGQGAAFYDDEGWLLGGGYIAATRG